jgi:hypothetical protein
MRIMNIRIDEDGTVLIDYAEDREQSPEGGVLHQLYVTPQGRMKDEQVGYYIKELIDDATEVIAWYWKYRRGDTL